MADEGVRAAAAGRVTEGALERDAQLPAVSFKPSTLTAVEGGMSFVLP